MREILPALIFAAALFEQAMLVPDAFQGVVADAQIELANKLSGPKVGSVLRSSTSWASTVEGVLCAWR